MTDGARNFAIRLGMLVGAILGTWISEWRLVFAMAVILVVGTAWDIRKGL